MKSRIKNTLRLVSCALGATLGLGLTLWLIYPPSSPFLLASLGGSTVFLFGLTQAAAAQPRALFGGHLGGALIGILCTQAFGCDMWVYVLACVITLGFMLLTKTMHPPAGATPLIMVQAHAALPALWHPVGLGVVALAAIAAAWTRLVPGMLHYPVKWLDSSPPSIWWGGWDE